jgi:hypothetical protein
MTSRMRRARRTLALFVCIVSFGLAAPALADNYVITQLKVDPVLVYKEPSADRAQAKVESELKLESQFLRIVNRRDGWSSFLVEGEPRWVHDDDVVIMRAPGRMAGTAGCKSAAGRTLC